MGPRELILLAIALLAVYVVYQLYRVSRPARPAPPAVGDGPASPEGERLAAPVAEALPGGDDGEGGGGERDGSERDGSVYAFPRPQPAPQGETPAPEAFQHELELRQLRRELEQQRSELGELRRALDAVREQLRTQKEQADASVVTGGSSPEYKEALVFARRGLDAEAIAERCGITVAEAELVQALARGQSGETGTAP